ncbi:MAG: hypothetical protein LBE46_02775 [Wolbachia pipientis]|nr:hypothetical protein [Wolbachia pipientis]
MPKITLIEKPVPRHWDPENLIINKHTIQRFR